MRYGSKTLRRTLYIVLRRNSSQEPCNPPPKAEPCPPPPASLSGTCPQPPPCPTIPPCPPTLCPPNPDPNNPCNYCPPPCIDPDAPDLVKLKRLQCKFQEDNDLPVHLKGGNYDVALYHVTVISTLISALWSIYGIYELAVK